MFKIDPKLVEKFEENGFLLFKGAVKAKIYKPILEVAKVHLKYKIPPIESEYEYSKIDKKEYKESVRRLRGVYDRDILFKNWMQNTLFCEYFNAILKDKPVLVTAHHNSIMTKMPKSSTQTNWHRDIRYWSYENDNLISIWLALGDEFSQNGVLEFIPKSHKMKFPRSAFDERLYFREDLEENQKIIQTKVSFELKAGDVILFHASTLHRANKNITDKPKISFVYTIRGSKNLPIPNTRSAKHKEISICQKKQE
jgi:phytanoyl-CoA hydroxylase